MFQLITSEAVVSMSIRVLEDSEAQAGEAVHGTSLGANPVTELKE